MQEANKDIEELVNELLLPKDKPMTVQQYRKNKAHLEAYLKAAAQLYGDDKYEN